MDFIVKLAQTHESFRLAEIEALADVEGVDLTVVEYSPEASLSTSTASEQGPSGAQL